MEPGQHEPSCPHGVGELFSIPLGYKLTSNVIRFLDAVPTAELEPFSDTYVQSDEVCPPDSSAFRHPISLTSVLFVQIDMGMTYDELSVFGRMRKVEKCGPFAMYTKLLQEWGNKLPPEEVSTFAKAWALRGS